MKDFIKRLDFDFLRGKGISFLPVIILLLTYPAMKFLPVEYSYENHFIENFQLVILLVTFIVCVKAKADKKFFNTLALVCVILFLREVNCGRTIFFAVEGSDNAFYSWKEIPHGWIVNPLYIFFMIMSALYFVVTKSYRVLIKYIIKAKISVYNWACMILGIILGLVGEKMSAPMLEEMTETLFYVSFLALVWLQGFNRAYIAETDETQII